MESLSWIWKFGGGFLALIKNRTILLILPFDMCIIIIDRKNWR